MFSDFEDEDPTTSSSPEEQDIDMTQELYLYTDMTYSTFTLRTYTLRDPNISVHIDTFISVLKEVSQTPNADAIRLKITYLDRDGIEYKYKDKWIRFDIPHITDTSLSNLKIHIQQGTVPPYIKHDTLEMGSDTAISTQATYHVNTIQACINKTVTPSSVSHIIGSEVLDDKYKIKMIAEHDITYTKGDCIYKLLNEITGNRYQPSIINKELFGQEDIQVHNSKKIDKICHHYSVHIRIRDIERKKNIYYGDKTLAMYDKDIIKKGLTIGIYDGPYVKPNVQDTLDYDILYYDLETVGEDQAIYGYRILSNYIDTTMISYNTNMVEASFISTLNNHAAMCTKPCTIAYAWNGSRFDSHIVMKLYMSLTGHKVYSIILTDANELLSFTIYYGDKRIMFRDPMKMFQGSLSDIALAFKLDISKETLDHDEIESLYYKGMLDYYIVHNRHHMISYVTRDVDMLKAVCLKISEMYLDTMKLNPEHYLTRSMACYVYWNTIVDKDILNTTKFPLHDVKHGIMSDAIGGRTQCFERGIYEHVSGIDVKSMYPYVAQKHLYPCGNIVSGYSPGKLGIYKVRVIRQSWPNVIPYRDTKIDPYDWNYTGEIVKWMTNIDMEQLDSYEILDGFHWDNSTDSFFRSYMLEMYDKRMDNLDNKSLNLHYKMSMNSLIGATFQKSLRNYQIITSAKETEDYIKSNINLIDILMVSKVTEDYNMITCKPKVLDSRDTNLITMQLELCSRSITNKPWVLNMFVYSYARRKLRNKIIALSSIGCKILYCDTDSIYYIGTYLPRSNTKLGAWTIDFQDKDAVFHCVKVYAIKDVKIRVKGISDKAVVWNNAEDICYDDSYQDLLETYIKYKGSHISYTHVEMLVKGYHLYSLHWNMVKDRERRLYKSYMVKHIRPIS